MASRALDLYSPKFGLDQLGRPGEKVVIKVTLLDSEKLFVIFGTYRVGSRHAQISSDLLLGLNDSVKVSSVIRYTPRDAVRDIDETLSLKFPTWNLQMTFDESLHISLDSRLFPASMSRFYTVGGKLYLVIRLLGKRIRIEFLGNGARVFDSSRRELTGMTAVGNTLVLRRKFQHPELAAHDQDSRTERPNFQ
jgi:hypothetical protein